jgi:succinate dehydrogenase / fumarate reductase cytochrome b subunit
VSGVVLFVLMPLLTISLYWSLKNENIFNWVLLLFDTTLFKLIKCLMLWGIIHHLIAGTRHLLLDLHFGVDLIIARMTSKIVLAVSFLLTFIAGIWLW